MSIESLGYLLDISKRRIGNTDIRFIREIYNSIEWESRLILLKGCRGVGKTYMMLQYIKMAKASGIYLSLDNIFFLSHTVAETIDTLYKAGFRLFGLDEIHKYPNWSIELKNIYDNYHDIRLVITSSSALDIMAGQGDLSRRLDEYRVRGLTFIEFMSFEYGITLPSFTFDELLTNQIELYDDYLVTMDIQKRFNTYIKRGYYPYYKESGLKYHDRLQAVILQVIDSDMSAIFRIDYESTRQIKKMLSLISRMVPFSPNVAKLSRDLSMSRNSVLTYIDYLTEADIIFGLKASGKSDSAMTKPDKIYFENTNMLHAFDAAAINVGTIRETFVMNTLSNTGYVSTPLKGDFMLDERYIIEVGGANKNFHQLHGMPNGVLVKEGIDKGGKDVLAMWTLGLLRRKV